MAECKISWRFIGKNAKFHGNFTEDYIAFLNKKPLHYTHSLPAAGSAQRAALPVLFLLTGRFSGFSPRRGDTLHRSRWNLTYGPLLRAVPNFTLIGPGVGVYGPKNWKKWNFTNIIAPKGRVPCTISTKFTSFMRVLSLHNFAKFGCFISINDKIINN